MANIKVEVTMPDSFYRLIEDASWKKPSRTDMAAAFQEMISLLGILLSARYHPDMDDVMYFKDMEDNVAVFGDGRRRTPEAQAIGKQFLELLPELTQRPVYQELIEEENRRGDDPPHADPGGGMQIPDDSDDDDDDDRR